MVKIHKCGIGECKYESKRKSDLTRHKAHKHDIGVKLYKCTHEDCDAKFKQKNNLTRHKAYKHNIEVKWYKCTHQGCDAEFKQKNNLTEHLAYKHDKGVVWYKCTQKDCTYKAKHKGALTRHLADKHDIGVVWYKCTQKDCTYKAKQKGSLTQHKAHKHDIGVIWYKCTQNDCTYKAKQKGSLTRHLSGIHDIGPHECDYCVKNTYSTNKYVCPNTHIESSICRDCYRKVTGYTSRIEKEISEYLDEVTELFPYLVGSDMAFKTLGGCSLYRPDKLYIGVDLNIIFECDEHQHSGSSYKCDERRISEIFDEFETKKLVVVRWNPDSYKVPKDTKRVPKKERFQRAREVLLDVLKNPPSDPVSVLYMYYDEDNDNVVRNLPKTFVR